MKLEKYLVLNKYLLSLFGSNNISDFREELRNKPEGFENNGRSDFISALIIKDMKVSRDELFRYDNSIKQYSEKLSKNRRENVSLKYFQYLAILFAEIYLDLYFKSKKCDSGSLNSSRVSTRFLNQFNSFLKNYNEVNNLKISDFEENDLKKLAYWMATGSGKTLIMHINYWQFLKYNNEPIDNIILVTPNEGLSKQHFDEMQKSGVPCRLYTENSDSLQLYRDQVLIIDIHKLTETKKGAGVRVETSYFEGRNLVFIDEGHKGQKSEEQTWKKLREDLGKDGFLFEYSATFGQVIKESDKDLLEEYSKAIIFDYSYKYFYKDGYGKDFYVYNLKEDSFTKNYKDLILTANLLSFYEQSQIYKDYKNKLNGYLIEKPLWAFVGSKVTGKGLNSDVLQVVLFLKKIIEDKSFLKNNIIKILDGESGLLNIEGNDIFKERFKNIRENGYNINDIYEKLFNTNYGLLQIYEIKLTEGEIGLKIGEGNYFGVINIGDVSSFKKLLLKIGFEVKPDQFTPSLFEHINENNSNINILIGAKKFIEGWDSWRVCSMGLINMGKGEGPQIIQLFGRGVRLKGKNLSLKRSVENIYHIKSLETLNIFGLNADYINTFLETIRKEEVEYEEIKIPIKRLNENKWKRLYSIRTKVPKGFDDFSDYYLSKCFIKLDIDEDILRKIMIDIRPKIKSAHGLNTQNIETYSEKMNLINYINIINWNTIYLNILKYKVLKAYYNLEIDKTILKKIIESNFYEVMADSSQNGIKIFSDLYNIEEIVLILLKNYIDKFYNKKLRRKETGQLTIFTGIKEKTEEYKLKIELPSDIEERRKRKKEIVKIRKLISDVNKLYNEDIKEISTLHFDKHFYTPLVVHSINKDIEKKYITSIPAKLNKGETDFIKLLRRYIKDNKINDKEIFLLRNSTMRGINFYQTSGFFPDFVMWVKENDKQTIVFIEPHSLQYSGYIESDEKIQLYKYLKEKTQPTINKNFKNVKIDSFIISTTKYKDIKKYKGNITEEEFKKHHVLFMEDENLIDKLFCMIN